MSLTKITGTTTLGEVALRRGQLGVTHLTITYDLGLEKPVRALLFTEDFRVVGRGETEADALDDAFYRLTHRIGEALASGIQPESVP